MGYIVLIIILTIYLLGYIIINMNNIGKQVKQLRKKYKITQVELAIRARVGLRFIRELEQGKPTVRLDKVSQVLKFFGYYIDIQKNENSLDRSAFSISTGFDETKDIEYWKKQDYLKRFQYISFIRALNYGYESSTTGFQRFFEIAKLKKS